MVHASLDAVEKRTFLHLLAEGENRSDGRAAVSGKPKGPAAAEMYLGLLSLREDFRIYGYLTSTKFKIFLVVDNVDVRDADMKTFLRSLHSLLVQTVANPFYEYGTEITSPQFANSIRSAVQGSTFNRKVY